MSDYQILHGDCLDVLRTLPSGSVQMCVTSPPYYGLRDYGTATWVGGDPACDHRPGNARRVGATTLGGGTATAGHQHEGYRAVCGKCGALRQDDQIGLEPTVDEYVGKLVAVFDEVKRVLRDDGTLWLNLGDSYSSGGGKQVVQTKNASHGLDGMRLQTPGIASKQLLMVPARVALALQAAGWWLRADIIWHKANPMPESVTDRPTRSHEHIFLLTKSARYFYDSAAVAEPAQVWTGQAAQFERMGAVSEHVLPGQAAAQHRPNRNGHNAFRGQGAERTGPNGSALREGRDTSAPGAGPTRNQRDVWTVATRPYAEAHFATFPPEIPRRAILAGSKPGDTVLDPFGGSGTTAAVAVGLGRRAILCELNAAYIELAEARIGKVQRPLLGGL